MAAVPRTPANAMSEDERQTCEHAAQSLCHLERLKRDLVASDPDDEGESERLTAELVSLLGLHRGS